LCLTLSGGAKENAFTVAGEPASTMSFKRVVTAGTDACCNRAIDWRNAVIRASRRACSKTGSFCQRISVLAENVVVHKRRL
jgi:hypothetical protein